MSIQITIPFLPISVNQAYRSFRGRVVKSKKYLEFEQKMCPYLSECERLEGNLKMTVQFFRKSRHKFDLDNLLKSLLDVLEGAVFDNDDQIYEIHVTKCYSGFDQSIVHIEKID